MGFKVITEPTVAAEKFMIYGLAGSGKTTFASKLKNSLIVDIEGGANKISTPRTERIKSTEQLYTIMADLYREPERKFDTICFDSADWLARLIIEDVAGIDKKNLDATLNKSNGGYGNGKQVLENHVRSRLLPMLAALIDKGYNVCLLAHAAVKDITDADGMDVEKLAPKIDPVTLDAFVEWCDDIFYLKNVDGERTITLEDNGSVLAKNRLGLHGTVKLSEFDMDKIINEPINNK